MRSFKFGCTKLIISYLMLLSLITSAAADTNDAIIELKNGKSITGLISEVNDAYLILDQKETVYFRVMKSIILYDTTIVRQITNKIDGLTTRQNNDSSITVFFDKAVFPVHKEQSDSQSVNRHAQYFSAGMFFSPEDNSFGFTLRTSYSYRINDSFSAGAFAAFNDWKPNKSDAGENSTSSSSSSSIIEIIPEISYSLTKPNAKSEYFLQFGIGYALLTASSFVITGNAESESISRGALATVIGAGTITKPESFKPLTLDAKLHFIYFKQKFTPYFSIDIGISLLNR
jgi:hypothetical protein